MIRFLLISLMIFAPIRAQMLTSIVFAGASAVAYTGPGDIVTGAKAWWGLRAYSAATRGTKAANVCNVADVVCTDFLTDATTGALVITTVGGSLCSVITCTVKTLYDQTGSTNCTTACDLTQATIATRPVLTTSCIGALPCMTWTSTQHLDSPNQSGAASPAPQSVSAVGERTGAFTSFGDITGAQGGLHQVGFNNSANTVFIYAGGAVVTASSVADSAFHAFQALFSGGAGTTSIIYVDGVSTGSLNTGFNNLDLSFCMGSCGNGFTGKSTEAGWWVGDSSASFATFNGNQHTYWGF